MSRKNNIFEYGKKDLEKIDKDYRNKNWNEFKKLNTEEQKTAYEENRKKNKVEYSSLIANKKTYKHVSLKNNYSIKIILKIQNC